MSSPPSWAPSADVIPFAVWKMTALPSTTTAAIARPMPHSNRRCRVTHRPARHASTAHRSRCRSGRRAGRRGAPLRQQHQQRRGKAQLKRGQGMHRRHRDRHQPAEQQDLALPAAKAGAQSEQRQPAGGQRRPGQVVGEQKRRDQQRTRQQGRRPGLERRRRVAPGPPDAATANSATQPCNAAAAPGAAPSDSAKA